jgi:hypothetical protein
MSLLGVGVRESGAQPAGPSAGELLASDLKLVLGLAIGPDGAAYVPLMGSGGATEVLNSPFIGPVNVGFTASIIRIDPTTGAQTTVATGLPSAADAGHPESARGAADIVFMGDTLYYMTFFGGQPYGLPNNPVGIYRVNSGGTHTLIADLGAFAVANPGPASDQDDPMNPHDGPPRDPFGEPYDLEVRGNSFLVADAELNRILSVTLDGKISIAKQLENVVPTGSASANGTFFVSLLGPFPNLPSTGKVIAVNPTTGVTADVAGGVSNMIQVDFDGITLYSMNLGDQQDFDDPPGGPFWPAEPFTGAIWQVDVDQGRLIPKVTGFNLPIHMEIANDTAFVLTLTGELWKVENLSGQKAATPTTTASTTATPPETPTMARTTMATATAAATGTSMPAATAIPPTMAPTRIAPMPPNTGAGGSGGDGTNVLLVLGACLVFCGAAAIATLLRKAYTS